MLVVPFADLRGVRGWLAAVGAILGWAGLVTLGSWGLARYGGRGDVDVQPAPEVLWQVGLVLLVVGGLLLAPALVRAAVPTPDTPALGSARLDAAFSVAFLLATDVPAVTTAVVARHSALVWLPLFFAGMATVAGGWAAYAEWIRR